MLDTTALAGFKGKSLNGTWTLRIQDAEARDEGTLKQFGLELVFEAGASRAAAIRNDGVLGRRRRGTTGHVKAATRRRTMSRRTHERTSGDA
jgi:subtilisin-like proprotein convertase family protein